jgi:hypothetical protein
MRKKWLRDHAKAYHTGNHHFSHAPLEQSEPCLLMPHLRLLPRILKGHQAVPLEAQSFSPRPFHWLPKHVHEFVRNPETGGVP